MSNLRGTHVLRGRGRGRGEDRVRQPQMIPEYEPEQQEPQMTLNELQRMRRMLREQQILINELLSERQERQVERQEESYRLTERNLQELRKTRNLNNRTTGHNEFSHKNPPLKRKFPEDNNQGKRASDCIGFRQRNSTQKSSQTKQQYNPKVTGPQLCVKCGRKHPQSTNCDGKLICFKCQEPGHICMLCPGKAVGFLSKNPPKMPEFLPCSKYGNFHPGLTCSGIRICYLCRKPGHMAANCPQKAAETESSNSGQMLALPEVEAEESPATVHETNA